MTRNDSAVPFGPLLRSFRVRAGLTQRQLADLSTLSMRTIRDIELRKATQSRSDTVRLLADALNLHGPRREAFESAAGQSRTNGDVGAAHRDGPIPPPTPLKPIIGRETEIAALVDFFASSCERIINVVGIPGVGKSRLALEAATRLHRMKGLSVMWTEPRNEAPAQSGSGLLNRIKSMTSRLLDRSESPLAHVDDVVNFVNERETLIVIDGVDTGNHTMDHVCELLQRCDDARVLVTSTEPVLAHDHVTPLAPLPVPDPTVQVDEYSAMAAMPSVGLLLSAIRRVRPQFEVHPRNVEAVLNLCRGLDGVPLAIEEAAWRCVVQSPHRLLNEMDRDPVAFLDSMHGRLRDIGPSLKQSIDGLERSSQELLNHLVTIGGQWSVDEVASELSSEVTDIAEDVHSLLMRGLLRPAGDVDDPRFRVINVVRWYVDAVHE